MEHKIMISGSGGQGVLFGGVLVARAAMLEGSYVTYFPSYGAEIRGGAAMSSVIISDEPIGSPVIDTPDSLIILNEVSFKKYSPLATSRTLVIINDSIIKSFPRALSRNFYRISASEIAIKKVGDVRTTNAVMIGYWTRILSSVTESPAGKFLLKITSLEAAALALSKTPKAGELNKNALYEGYNYRSG